MKVSLKAICFVSFFLFTSFSWGNPCSSSQLLAKFPRLNKSFEKSGTQLARPILGLDSHSKNQSERRDLVVLENVACGNIPASFKKLEPVFMADDLIICVTPDYLSVGKNSDNVRLPLSQKNAVRLASALGFLLPTEKMVNQIYRQSDLKPSFKGYNAPRTTTARMVESSRFIDRQIGDRSGLIAGHKKDIIFSHRSNASGKNPARVAIFGAWDARGNRIQPHSTVHTNYYSDYSHGVRLVSEVAFIKEGGIWQGVNLKKLLRDPEIYRDLHSGPRFSNSQIAAYNAVTLPRCEL